MLRKSGFTLIELLIVIAIIAVLLTILAPALQESREHAKRVQCASHHRKIVVALRMYDTSNRRRLPSQYRRTGTEDHRHSLPGTNYKPWQSYIAYDIEQPIFFGPAFSGAGFAAMQTKRQPIVSDPG